VTVKVIFECDRCGAVSEPRILSYTCEPVPGVTYGLGSQKWEDVREKVPEGWDIVDLIGCTFCSDCCKKIWQEN